MTQEEKQLLFIDLCARLPYGVWVECCGVSAKLDNIWLTHFYNGGNTVVDVNGNTDFFHDSDYFDITKIKPYLRPMSSMTEDEMSELRQWGCLCMTTDGCVEDIGVYGAIHSIPVIDWLIAHHFDYRGMIEKGLALPAPEGMY